MEFDLDQAVALLQTTPSILRAWLGSLPSAWVFSNDGEGTWSPYDVVGHLILGEKTDWIPRAKIILSETEPKEFEPFDRFAMLADGPSTSMEALLDEFEGLRRETVERLRGFHITEADFGRTGLHPTLGEVTLRQLLSTWVAHDLNHLGQIAEVMARQYKQEVGPWKEFLGILGA